MKPTVKRSLTDDFGPVQCGLGTLFELRSAFSVLNSKCLVFFYELACEEGVLAMIFAGNSSRFFLFFLAQVILLTIG